MRFILLVVFVMFTAAPLVWGKDIVNEHYLEIGGSCVTAHEPKQCMESYGFFCNQSRRLSQSINAQHLGCNLDLGDGRYHFVQMLYDNGGWNIEVENTYVAEYDEPRSPQDDSSLALSSYIEQEMAQYRMQATGAGTNAQGQDTSFVSGARRIEGRLAVSANCGSVVGVERDSDVDTTLADDCEKLLLRTVKSLSQSTPDQPYLVPAPSDFDWNEKLVTLASSDTALILEGRYEFADVHTPCRWVSDCCSVGGIYYLDSCREPTASELEVVQTCLSKAKSPRSSEFEGCLRSAGVKTGCEVQPDGSKICY